MRHQALVAEWLSSPWALKRDVLSSHVTLMASRLTEDLVPPGGYEAAGTGRPSAFEARRQQSQALAGSISSGGIAVLPIVGTIVQRAGMMTEMCGGTSTQVLGNGLQSALDDPSVSKILLDVDSPGGSVFGVQELAAQIYAARRKKPIVAAINSMAASAAYWLASQATEVFITPGGEAGSIGVWMAHEDWSRALEMRGVKVTLVSSGKFKTEGNPYGPLPEESKAFLQSRTEDYYRAFVGDVARGRGVGQAAVRSGMGQGRVLGAEAAKAQNMVDGIETFSDVVKLMQRSATHVGTGRASASSGIASSDHMKLNRAIRTLQILGH